MSILSQFPMGTYTSSGSGDPNPDGNSNEVSGTATTLLDWESAINKLNIRVHLCDFYSLANCDSGYEVLEGYT